MTGLTVKALNMSGELEQNLGGSEAVFKNFAGKMQEIGKTAFKDMGLGTSDFLATANKMGALFQGAGFGIKESADLSSKAMQRAADVASIMGIDTKDAMEAVAGAAKGNFTMMDNLGVAMNDTAIQNYALSKGINKTTAEMTQQEKIGLAMEMFLDKTSYAAGNYAKENETLAGSLGTAKSALTNFLDGSGTVEDVVSALSNAGKVIVKNINELLPKLVTGLTELVNQIVPLLPPLLQSLLPGIITGAVSLINGLVQALPQIVKSLMDALPALISGLEQIFNALVKALPQIMQVICNALPTVIPLLINAIISMILTLMQYLPQIIQPLIDNLPEIIISIVAALMDNLPALIDGCIQLIIALVQALPQIMLALIDSIPTIISSVVGALLQAWPQLISGVIQVIGALLVAMWEYIKGWWARIWEAIKGILKPIGDFFSSIWEGIKNVFSPVIDFFKNMFAGAWDGIKTAFSSIGNFFSGIWNGIKNTFSNVGSFFTNIFKGAYNGITGIFGKIGGFFKKVFNEIGNIVKAPINFVIKGLNALIGGLNKISFDIPSWIPVIGGKKFGFNIGKIPQLEKGGVLKKGQTGYLEGNGDEAVVPLEKNTGWIKRVAENISQFNIKNKAEQINPNNNEIYQVEFNNKLDKMQTTVEMLISVLLKWFPELAEALNITMIMDDGTVAAKLAPKLDKQLGDIYKKKGRGN